MTAPATAPAVLGEAALRVRAALAVALDGQPDRKGAVTHVWLRRTTGLSRRGVTYGLRELERAGQLHSVPGQGRGKASVFQLVEPAG